jgi:hypothetical protein
MLTLHNIGKVWVIVSWCAGITVLCKAWVYRTGLLWRDIRDRCTQVGYIWQYYRDSVGGLLYPRMSYKCVLL